MHTLLTIFGDADATAEANCGNGPANPCKTGLPKLDATTIQLQHGLEIVFGALAAVSVLMIVVAGLRFVTAQGNPNEIAKARKTIIYAVAGLAVSLSSEAIVALVLGKV